MSTTVEVELPEVEEIGLEEGRALFDRAARELVGMSGPRFLDKWDRGDYQGEDLDAHSGLVELVMLIPLGR